MIALLSLAFAGDMNPFPVTLSGGLVYHYAEGHGGTGMGRMLIHNRNGLALDVAGGEGAAAGPGRHLGTVHIGGRYHFAHNAYVRGGFHHMHETTFDDLVAAPGATLAGQGENIVHRSGAQLAVGGQYHWVDLIPNVEFFRRLDTGVDLSAAYMPASEGPGLYIGVEVWSSINVGRERS
jgi:hypothetical protein